MTLIRSSRLRITLISVCLSGLVLLAFGSVIWWKLSRDRLATLDAKLETIGQRVATHSQRVLRGETVRRMVDSALGTDDPVDHFFVASDRAGRRMQSQDWPEELELITLLPGENEVDSIIKSRGGGTKHGRSPRRQGDFAGGARDSRQEMQFEPRYYTIKHGGRDLRIGAFGNREITFRFGADLGQHAEDIRQLRNAFLMSLPGALLVIALGSLYVSHKAFRPVESLSDRMENLSAQGVHERLDPDGVDHEYQRMTVAYNAMLERLERSFTQATRFSADASHELKTPLAVMRGKLEQAISRSPNDSDQQRLYASLLEETDLQQNILESLLLLSRAEGGKLALTLETLNFSDWLGDMIEDAGILAEERGLNVTSEIAPDLRVKADPILLQRAVHNLLDNAVKYNEEHGKIHCHLEAKDSKAILTISNTGQKIDKKDRDRLFDRFERGSSQGERREGLGLGLSLVKEIAVAHGGKVTFQENSGPMTTIALQLPLSNQPDVG